MGLVRGLTRQCQIWFVADGAYAARPVLLPLGKLGVVTFSRLRKDAVLFDLPPQPKSGQPGRHRIDGFHRISLSKRAAHHEGWQTMTYNCRGAEVTQQYKSFLATSQLGSRTTAGPQRLVEPRLLAFESMDVHAG